MQKEYNYNGNTQINMKETKNNFNNGKNINKYDESTPPDLFTHPQINNRNQHYNKNVILDPLLKKQSNQNMNSYVLNRKEAKKYEDLLKYGSNINEQSNLNNQHNHGISSIKPIKNGKVFLDPINNQGFKNDQNQSKKNFYPPKNKKMEVSFKATLKFTDDLGNNNKFEFSPEFNVHNQNIN